MSCGLALLVAFAALVLAACGSSDTTTTATTNTAAPSPAVAVTVSSAPTPTPTHTWTPGAKPIPAATFPAQEGTTAVGEAATGWVFTPTVDIQVTHLGYFDDSGDGLRHDHPAGIFDMATKKLLVKTIVRRQSPLEASYRFVKIAPVTLKAGREYAVVAYAMPPFDPEVNWPEGLVWAPEIEVGDNVYTETSKLAYPTAHTSDLYLTPNFKFRPTFASVAAATIPAQEGTTEGFKSSTNGWEFKPTVDIQVTDLGYFDDGGDGLRHPHPVGIFDVCHAEAAGEDHRPEDEPAGRGLPLREDPAPDPHGGHVLRGGHRLLPALRSRGQRPDGAGLRARDRVRGLPRDVDRRVRVPGDQPATEFITANFKYKPL